MYLYLFKMYVLICITFVICNLLWFIHIASCTCSITTYSQIFLTSRNALQSARKRFGTLHLSNEIGCLSVVGSVFVRWEAVWNSHADSILRDEIIGGWLNYLGARWKKVEVILNEVIPLPFSNSGATSDLNPKGGDRERSAQPPPNSPPCPWLWDTYSVMIMREMTQALPAQENYLNPNLSLEFNWKINL